MMAFNSLAYLIFLPSVIIGYYVLPKRARKIWLLVGSYYFYMSWNPKYALLMLLSTIITYASGLLIGTANKFEDADKGKRQKKTTVALSFISNLSILFFFKYFNFFNQTLDRLFETLNLPYEIQNLNILLPVGISFYTFQALSYTMDVYRGKISAEGDFISYALFVSFFPQLVAGPIEKSRDLLPQVRRLNKASYDNLRYGVVLILWGFVKKVVIADRLALLVNQVYNNVGDYGGPELIIATIYFSFQIYCDFSSYSDIARGSSKLIGIELMQNFKRPYFSKSVSEFWTRWHISLSEWFRENLYIPLGGNRKGKTRQILNTMTVFLVSGLWHGAGFTYIVWGGLNGLFIIIEKTMRPITQKLKIGNISEGLKSCILFSKVMLTFLLINVTWIFFRANSISDALMVLKSIFKHESIQLSSWTQNPNMGSLGLNTVNMKISFISIIVLLGIELLISNINIIDRVIKTKLIVRWSIYLLLIFIIVVFGIYGKGYDKSQFIYFQF